MPRRVRVVLAALVLALAPAAAARAQDELPPAAPITAAQLASLDTTLGLMIPTEGEHPRSAEITAAELQCGSLAAGDRLQARFASLCSAQLRIVRAGLALETCEGSKRCRDVFADIRRALRQTQRAAKRWNRLLPVVLADPGCVRALDVSRGELRSLRRLQSAYALLSTAVRNRSERRLAQAERRFEQAGQPASAALVRRRMRAACLPAG